MRDSPGKMETEKKKECAVPSSADGPGEKTCETSPSPVQAPPQTPDTTSASILSENGSHSATVARHYNQLQESGLQARVKSRIFYMRNLNNWIKSVLIAEFLQAIRKQKPGDYEISVLDLASGKGGDLLKWKKGHIRHLICADIAGTSVEQSEARFKEMVARNSKERHPQKMFTSEFITADCTQARLKDLFKNPSHGVDLTSCQFSFHYSFESYEQADKMLQNACEALKPGGYFIGTTPNAYELVKRWRSSEDNSFGNEVYRITFDSDNKEDIPLFGAKYMFHLEGVVDCPEFLVHFPTLVRLAKKHGMNLMYKKTFGEYVSEHAHLGDSRALLGIMQALEPYPPAEGFQLLCENEDGYTTAKEVHTKLCQEAEEKGEGQKRQIKVGTLSKDEWEAATLYLVFAFQKEDTTQQQSAEQTTKTGQKRPHEEVDETTVTKRPREEVDETTLHHKEVGETVMNPGQKPPCEDVDETVGESREGEVVPEKVRKLD